MTARVRAAAVVAIVLLVVGVVRIFIVPPVDAVSSDLDAIVVLGGGIRNERLLRGLEAIEQAPGATLILSIPYGEGFVECPSTVTLDDDTTRPLACVAPDPATTTGEAAGLSALIAQSEWDHIAFVTSTYHVTRAGLLFDRCLDIPVDRIEAPVSLTEPRLYWRVVTEIPSLMAALTFDRPDC